MDTSKHCGELIMAIAEMWQTRARQRMAELGLSAGDMELLSLISDGGKEGLTLRQVERIACLSQPTASRLVSSLHKRGLVAYLADKRDLRSKHACLTEEGKRVYGEICSVRDRAREEALRMLSDNALAELEKLLMAVRTATAQPSSE